MIGLDTSVPSINLIKAASSVQNILNITALLSGVTDAIVFDITNIVTLHVQNDPTSYLGIFVAPVSSETTFPSWYL